MVNMYSSSKHTKKGFTLIEVIVVIAIISILLSVVLFAIVQARKDGRDKKRVSDLANIELALTLYKEKNRDYPVYPNGVELGRGGTLDDDILLFNGNTYVDPLNDAPDGEYGYWYYSNFLCNGKRVNVVIAKKMEKTSNGNYDEVCNGMAMDTSDMFDDIFTHIVPWAYAAAPTPCRVNLFTATPAITPPGGGDVRFRWSVSRAQNNRVSISPGIATNLRRSGSITRRVTATTDFTLAAVSSQGGAICSGTRTVTVPPLYTQSAYTAAPGPGSDDDSSPMYIVILK